VTELRPLLVGVEVRPVPSVLDFGALIFWQWVVASSQGSVLQARAAQNLFKTSLSD